MNKAVVIAAILIVFGGGYVLLKEMTELRVSEAPASTSGEKVRITTATERGDTEAYTVNAKYPQFGILSIDADIKGKVDAALSEFKALPPNPPESATPKNEFTGTFEDVYVGPDVVSVKLILSQYTGGAHPMTIVSGLNYDRATGRQLLQQDAFAMIGMDSGDVSAKATAELKEKLGKSFFEEGANSNPENFSSFVISEHEVMFIFQAYQVGPYAAGPQEVSFARVK